MNFSILFPKKEPQWAPCFPGKLPCITCKAGANIESFLLVDKMFSKKNYKKIQQFGY
jgi:hypothetical protein